MLSFWQCLKRRGEAPAGISWPFFDKCILFMFALFPQARPFQTFIGDSTVPVIIVTRQNKVNFRKSSTRVVAVGPQIDPPVLTFYIYLWSINEINENSVITWCSILQSDVDLIDDRAILLPLTSSRCRGVHLTDEPHCHYPQVLQMP